jgi:ATP-binding cassette subfamily C (CFTR/MRP) protein 4
MAFIEQEHYVFPGTVQSNILFGLPYNKALYDKIVDVCCLKDDLMKMSDGDLTEIGSDGGSLSGGQKSRICLARALYT